MYAVQSEEATRAPRGKGTPSDELRIGVTFKRPSDNLGPTKMMARLSSASVSSFVPEPLQVDRAIYELHRRGFTLTRRGRLSVSVRGTRQQFQKVFGTSLETFRLPRSQNADAHAFYYPPPGAPWNPDPALMEMIDDAYIQWPHMYMARKRRVARKRKTSSKPDRHATTAVSAVPPHVDYYHLEMPTDVPALLNATRVHRAGATGKGVRIAMIDSGFATAPPTRTAMARASRPTSLPSLQARPSLASSWTTTTPTSRVRQSSKDFSRRSSTNRTSSR
jgi:hypothetical protein